MKLSNIIFAGISLLITPAAGKNIAGDAYWQTNQGNLELVSLLRVTGGCISFGGQAANMATIILGIGVDSTGKHPYSPPILSRTNFV
jgi:uncharacterized membrane protein